MKVFLNRAWLAMAGLLFLGGCAKPEAGALSPTAPGSAVDVSQRAADGESAFAENPPVAVEVISPENAGPTLSAGSSNSIPPNLSPTLDGKWSVSYQQSKSVP